ncbi:MAG: hypothetical protein ACRCR7_07065 [Weissella cibaria]
MALKINDNGTQREMTAHEAAEYKAWQVIAKAETQAELDAIAAKTAARQAVLDKLGLTADEAAALFG